jgi:hypothetical protein
VLSKGSHLLELLASVGSPACCTIRQARLARGRGAAVCKPAAVAWRVCTTAIFDDNKKLTLLLRQRGALKDPLTVSGTVELLSNR